MIGFLILNTWIHIINGRLKVALNMYTQTLNPIVQRVLHALEINGDIKTDKTFLEIHAKLR